MKKVKGKTTTASKKQILYAHVSPANKTWVQRQAKLAGIHQGTYMDFVIKAARKGKFEITTSTRSR